MDIEKTHRLQGRIPDMAALNRKLTRIAFRLHDSGSRQPRTSAVEIPSYGIHRIPRGRRSRPELADAESRLFRSRTR